MTRSSSIITPALYCTSIWSTYQTLYYIILSILCKLEHIPFHSKTLSTSCSFTISINLQTFCFSERNIIVLYFNLFSHQAYPDIIFQYAWNIRTKRFYELFFWMTFLLKTKSENGWKQVISSLYCLSTPV